MVGQVEQVGKRVARAVPKLLPVMTIAANGLDIAQQHAGNPAGMLNEVVKRYSFIDIQAGKIDQEAGIKGAGSLIGAGLVGLAISALQ